MLQMIDAIYEKGRFTPLTAIALRERQRVKIVFVPADEQALADDLPTQGLALLAETSPAYEFLADPREDVYSLQDGEPIT
jgi:hypothetical protein